MYLVTSTEPGRLEIRYTWLPTWMGINSSFLARLDAQIGKAFIGRPMNEATLAEAHEAVVDVICTSFPQIQGLRDYIDALKFVETP